MGREDDTMVASYGKRTVRPRSLSMRHSVPGMPDVPQWNAARGAFANDAAADGSADRDPGQLSHTNYLRGQFQSFMQRLHLEPLGGSDVQATAELGEESTPKRARTPQRGPLSNIEIRDHVMGLNQFGQEGMVSGSASQSVNGPVPGHQDGIPPLPPPQNLPESRDQTVAASNFYVKRQWQCITQ